MLCSVFTDPYSILNYRILHLRQCSYMLVACEKLSTSELWHMFLYGSLFAI
jgi:hypothetical protein